MKTSFKEKLSQNPSNAEITVLLALEEQGLTRGMLTNTEICLEKTVPDAFWPTKGLAVYIDGPPHESEHRRNKDILIDARLESLGLTVLRFSYKVPLRQKRLKEIVARIQEELAK